MEKGFYCPLYKNNITQTKCDDLRLDVEFNHIVDENKPHLLTREQIKQGANTCIQCQIDKFKDFSENPEVIKKIEELEEKYKDDEEAIETIQRTKVDIAYIERKISEGNYDSQNPLQRIISLERHLSMWN